ncbi:MAG: hypothetical protein JWM99_3984 [Verrucomicrobiales bacterium]|nr:hypothetical protein [Verrucomicrobiales bacterium]
MNDGSLTSVDAAWADYDNDGFMDVVIANERVNGLFHNNGNSNHWINLKLVGTASNRSAIGAKVRIKATIAGRAFWQRRDITGSGSLGSQSDLRASFGLGDATNIDTVRIEWPSGTVQELHDLGTKQFLIVTEPARLKGNVVGGVYGVTYRWDDSQTNATLVAAEGLDEDIDIQEQGETHAQVWHYPSRAECLKCHTPAAGWSLGFNTWQLNREFNYGGITNNQIAALNQAGYFSTNVTGIQTLRALAAATNTAWSLEYRVRSYLAANCAQCHQPGTDCLAKWDARITTPTAAAGIINGPLVFPAPADPKGRVVVPGSLDHSMMFFNISNLKMPPLATTVVNTQAVNLLSEWITNGLANYQSFADWQLAFFNSTDLPTAAPDADPDGDGTVNQLEYLVGSNPLVSGDAWKTSIQPNASSVQIRFPRLANRAFEVQWCPWYGWLAWYCQRYFPALLAPLWRKTVREWRTLRLRNN